MFKTLFYCNLFLFFFIITSPLRAQQQSVLLIASYHPSFPTYRKQVRGLRSVFDKNTIHLDVEHLDSKRIPYDRASDQLFQSLKMKVKYVARYSCIITADDNALKFVLQYRKKLFGNIPVVFFGVNDIDFALKQNQNPDVTGIIESVSMEETLGLMKNLNPGVKNFVAISDDTPSGHGDLKHYLSFQRKFSTIIFNFIDTSKFTQKELSKKLKALEKNDSVLLLSAYHFKNEKRLLFSESLNFILNNLQRPVYHLWYHGLGQGITGGKIISHEIMARKSANTVMNILKGAHPSQVPVSDKSPNVYVFDYNLLKKFNINESLLPKDSIVINKERSVFDQYRQEIFFIIIIVVILSVAIIILSAVIVDLRKKKKVIKKQSVELNESLKEKELLLKEVHHRVKNNMQIISSLLSLQSNAVQNEEDKKLFDQSRERVLSMALVHEMLYQNELFTQINFHQYLNKIVHQIIDERHVADVKVVIETSELYIGLDVAIPLALCINELVVNSLKHAFHENDENIISIVLIIKNNNYEFTYRDNGCGFNNLQKDSNKLGLVLIEGLAKQLKGIFEYSGESGFLCKITFPV